GRAAPVHQPLRQRGGRPVPAGPDDRAQGRRYRLDRARHRRGTLSGGRAMSQRISQRVQGFTESVIREMTRVVMEHGGVNLAQGMPNWEPPREIIAAA